MQVVLEVRLLVHREVLPLVFVVDASGGLEQGLGLIADALDRLVEAREFRLRKLVLALGLRMLARRQVNLSASAVDGRPLLVGHVLLGLDSSGATATVNL